MYTLLDCIEHKCRDSYVLYIPTVHAFGLVLLTHTLLVQTHTHDVSAPCLFVVLNIIFKIDATNFIFGFGFSFVVIQNYLKCPIGNGTL